MAPFHPDDRPRLRPCEPRPILDDEGHLLQIALRDVEGIAQGMAVLSPPACFIASLLDGANSLREIQTRIARENGGAIVDSQIIGRLADQLDSLGFLFTPRFEALKAEALASYRSSPLRLPSCVGGVYPEDPSECRAFLDGYLAGAEESGEGSSGEIQGLVAPHIDYRRGGPCYAQAYRALRRSCTADLFVVFGTAHAGPDHLFTLTTKSYDTPLGAVPTDSALVDTLVAGFGAEELLTDELFHKNEHSIELQMVWLRHIFPDRAIQALPVLCSGIDEIAQPELDDRIVGFRDALAQAVKGRRVCFIAGADLSHVGVMYGDERGPTASELEAFKQADLQSLERFCSGSALDFAMDARRDRDHRRICGTAPMFAARALLAEAEADLLGYGQWTDGTDSVSYCAVALR